MERERLKLIVRNLELLVDSLKAEVYSDPEAYKMRQDEETYYNRYGHPDYDEIFEDDDD